MIGKGPPVGCVQDRFGADVLVEGSAAEFESPPDQEGRITEPVDDPDLAFDPGVVGGLVPGRAVWNN